MITGVILVNLLCLFNRKQRYNWEDLWYDTIVRTYDHIREENGLKKYAHFSIVLLLLPLFLISFLLVAPISTIGSMLKKKSKTQRKDKRTEEDDNQLYYQQMGVQYEDYIKSFWNSLDDNGNPLFEEKDKQLYYHHMSGQGTISCYDCGYKDEIVSFLHGVNDAAWGYQCQSCVSFHTLNDSQRAAKPLICSCGGELNRNKPIFCPHCKSKSMGYSCTVIT
jgi:hypothetical protein